MDRTNSDAPRVKIIPPAVYFIGIVVGLLVSIWMPIDVVPDLVAWVLGGLLVMCGAALTGSAIAKFNAAGTTVRPDRAASTLVTTGPYKLTRNPMYLGLAFLYLGIAIADQSVWAIILLPIVLAVIQRWIIEPEEAFLERHFGAEYIGYKERVRRWI